MGRGSGRAEESAEGRATREATRIRDRDPVEAGQIGLGAVLARGEVDTGRPLRAERLDLIESRVGGVDGGDRDHLIERRVADDAAGGGHVLDGPGTETEELQPPRRAGEAVDEDVGDRVAGALVHDIDDLDRVLVTDLGVDTRRDDAQVLVKEKEVIVVSGPAERIVPLKDQVSLP